MTSSVKKIVLGGLMAGLGTGLGWSAFMYVLSHDQVVNGPEFALSLIVPLLVSLFVWQRLGVPRRILVPTAYLTLMVPLFGLGMGGANILQMTIAGGLGGLFWVSPFMLYMLAKG